jgi:hypothetical protein
MVLAARFPFTTAGWIGYGGAALGTRPQRTTLVSTLAIDQTPPFLASV